MILVHEHQKKPYCNLCHSKHHGDCIIELRDVEENKELRHLAHEIWATSQLLENEGIEDGVDRVEGYLKTLLNKAY